MFDLNALEAAGFKKALTTDEWELLQGQVATQYARTTGGETVESQVAGGNVVVDYVLQRDNVRLNTEQNSQDQAPFGISMTVRYPEVVIIENIDDGRHVSCDASDTSLILLLADEIAKPLVVPGRMRTGERPDSSSAARPE